ncbi:MAG: GGDEF domain-containing protein [Patescibacteria group bacterium]
MVRLYHTKNSQIFRNFNAKKESMSQETIKKLNDEIAELKKENERLRKDASHDKLTGLPNKAHFEEELNSAVSRAKRQKGNIAVLFMDLNGFKKVNDDYGHETGDKLLVAAAQKLKAVTRGGDMMARLGGDEFTAIAFDVSEEKQAEMFAARVYKIFETPVSVGKNDFKIGISIGIAIGPAGEESPKEFLHRADLAMYQSKKEKKPWCFALN